MPTLDNLIEKEKVVVAKYLEDSGYYDNLTYFQENHDEFKSHYDIDEDKEVDNDYIEEYMDSGHQDDSEMHYEDYKYNLTSVLNQLGNNWEIEASNIDWRSNSGTLESDDIDRIISATLFHNGQCNTTIWQENGYLKGVSYHHDCPTGSWFTIKGI